MTGHYRLARLRISLLASTRIRRDRNPSPGLMAHCPKIKFARDRFSKLLYMCGFSHDASPLERTLAYQRLRSLALKRKRCRSQLTMLQATYSRKYVEAVDRLFDEFRQRTAAIAESVGMKIYYLVPLHPLEREKPRFTHRLAYRATEVASLDSSQLQLFSEGWCRAGVFAPNGHHRSGPRPRCSICRWIWRLSVVRVCGPRSNGRDRPHVPRASTNQCNGAGKEERRRFPPCLPSE
jgi:hypothetical protein